MRISDWRSDVCSSDLLQASAFWNAHGLEADLVAIATTTALRDALQARFDAHAKQYPPPGDRQNLFALAAGEAAGPLQAGLATAAALVLDPRNGTLARKSGVEGQRVSDSVGLGGRRNLKKKNKKNEQ